MSAIDNMIIQRNLKQRELDEKGSQNYIAYFVFKRDAYRICIDYSKLQDEDHPIFNIRFKDERQAKHFYEEQYFRFRSEYIKLNGEIIEFSKPKDETLVMFGRFDKAEDTYKIIASFRIQYNDYLKDKLMKSQGYVIK